MTNNALRWSFSIFYTIAVFFLTAACQKSVKSEQEAKNDGVPTEIKDTLKSKSDHEEEYQGDFASLVNEYEHPERSRWQNPDLVIDKLKNPENKVIADIGAGTGYFTFLLAKKARKVIAVDIDQQFLDYVEDRKTEFQPELSQKIETRMTQADQPGLLPREVDMVLIVNVYHYLDGRVDYLTRLREGMQPGGIIVLVDFKIGELPVGPENAEKVSVKMASDELKSAGFTVDEVDVNSLQYQYIITAKN